MIKISMGALVKTLTSAKRSFVVSGSEGKENIIWFVGGDNGYYGSYRIEGTPNEIDELTADRLTPRHGKTLLQYNTATQTVVGCCTDWYDIIKQAKQDAKKTVIV